ncbi:MAG: hypothetical protein MUW57_11945 [Pseudomonas sp.]|nr:hypothetical protein [Pseudomonas sp.]
MKQKLMSVWISFVLSLCLILGPVPAQDFAFYVLLVIHVLVWIGVLAGMVKGDVAVEIRRWFWISCASTGFQLYALIVSGNAGLAASCFLVSLFMVIQAFKDSPVDDGRSA